MNPDRVYLQHILDAIERVERFLRGFTFATFAPDEKTVAATIRQLEIIGEAANNLTKEFKQAHPEILYRRMIDMRNVVIHEYFGVEEQTVWNTSQEDLPKLKQQIAKILEG